MKQRKEKILKEKKKLKQRSRVKCKSKFILIIIELILNGENIKRKKKI